MNAPRTPATSRRTPTTRRGRYVAAAAMLAVSSCGWWASDPAPKLPAHFVEAEPPGTISSRELLVREAELARASGRDAYLQVYADWCTPCRALRESMEHPRMVSAYAGTHVVLMNHDLWANHLASDGLIADDLPVPSIFEITAEGELGRTVSGHAWGDNTVSNMAPVLDRFFQR